MERTKNQIITKESRSKFKTIKIKLNKSKFGNSAVNNLSNKSLFVTEVSSSKVTRWEKQKTWVEKRKRERLKWTRDSKAISARLSKFIRLKGQCALIPEVKILTFGPKNGKYEKM